MSNMKLSRGVADTDTVRCPQSEKFAANYETKSPELRLRSRRGLRISTPRENAIKSRPKS